MGFPANLNVSAAVSFAGIGPDRTTVKMVLVPELARNCHDIAVEGEFGLWVAGEHFGFELYIAPGRWRAEAGAGLDVFLAPGAPAVAGLQIGFDGAAERGDQFLVALLGDLLAIFVEVEIFF